MRAVRDVYVRHAVKATPKFDGNGISVMEENISYEDVPKIMQDIKQALPEMEPELNAIQQIGELLPDILDNPDIERNQKPAKECWEAYLWNLEDLVVLVWHCLPGYVRRAPDILC